MEPEEIAEDMVREWAECFVVDGHLEVGAIADLVGAVANRIHAERTPGRQVVGVHCDTSGHGDEPPGCRRP